MAGPSPRRPAVRLWIPGLVMSVSLVVVAAAKNQPGDPSAALFDPSQVLKIDLTLSPQVIAALSASPDAYQPATLILVVGDRRHELGVGVRLKGGLGSFRPLPGKAAFKVKMDHVVPRQTLLGLKKLTLNNMVQDASQVHEVLSYELFRAFRVPAPRTGYAFVRVNGEDYGLYLNVETFDDVSLPRWFPSTQHLYEGEYAADVRPGGAEAFEVDEGRARDRSDLQAFIMAAHRAGLDDWSKGVEAHADLGEMIRMWAVEKYSGRWDGYAGGFVHPKMPNNYYLHSDATGRFSMLPWGADQAWSSRIAFDGRGTGWLFDRCLEDQRCAASFREALRAVRDLAVSLRLLDRVDTLVATVGPWRSREAKDGASPEAVSKALAETRALIAARPAEVTAWLAQGPPR